MENKVNVVDYVAELDAKRTAMGMSYQDVADSCDVSKATVYRALTGKTEPTMQLLNNIAAAVQYREPREEILPDTLTQEAYITYLKALVRQKEEALENRAQQLHAHYNKQLRQARRARNGLIIVIALLGALIISLFLYDFMHLDRGWIQADAEDVVNSKLGYAVLSVRSWIGGLLWSA